MVTPSVARRALIVSFAVVLAIPVTARAENGPNAELVDVIVREAAPASDTAENLVERSGGTVGATLAIIGGFTASVPGDRIPDLEAAHAIISVTADTTVESTTAGWQDATNLGDYVPNEWKGSMLHTGYAIGVDQYWSRGITGEGIGVALIDTGVVPVEGLTLPGKVINAADLSFESQRDEFRHMDTYGHGTHLAGIIAGRDPAAPQELTIDNAESYFLGMAPDAHIVNVKVGDNEGAVDVSQVIAALDWVVQHKDDNGMNVRVVNLSFGTDSTQDPRLDPLSFAVEQAWHHGIVVVVAAGNDGNASAVRNPATNPYVIAVGAQDHGKERGKGAQPVPDWSSCGTDRTVDFIAPGAHIVSLKSPGSRADVEHSSARVADKIGRAHV